MVGIPECPDEKKMRRGREDGLKKYQLQVTEILEPAHADSRNSTAARPQVAHTLKSCY